MIGAGCPGACVVGCSWPMTCGGMRRRGESAGHETLPSDHVQVARVEDVGPRRRERREAAIDDQDARDRRRDERGERRLMVRGHKTPVGVVMPMPHKCRPHMGPPLPDGAIGPENDPN